MEYDYRCNDHGTFTVERKMGQNKPTEPCPKCDAEARRVFTPLPHKWAAGAAPN